MKNIFTYFLLTACFLNAAAQGYKKIHFDAILIDTHNDIPSATIEKKLQFDTDLKGKTHSDLIRMQEGGLDLQVFSIFCDGTQKDPYTFANSEIDSVYAWANRNPDKMVIVKTPKQLRKAIKEKNDAYALRVARVARDSYKSNEKESQRQYYFYLFLICLIQDLFYAEKN